jgi:hypothetical protein
VKDRAFDRWNPNSGKPTGEAPEPEGGSHPTGDVMVQLHEDMGSTARQDVCSGHRTAIAKWGKHMMDELVCATGIMQRVAAESGRAERIGGCHPPERIDEVWCVSESDRYPDSFRHRTAGRRK